MKVIKAFFGLISKVIEFIRKLVGNVVWCFFLVLGYSFLLALVFGANCFYPPSHWVHLLDHRPLAEEELSQTAKDLTIKWKAEAQLPVTYEKTDSLKPGTKVKALAVVEYSKDCRLMHEFDRSTAFILELPDGKRVVARLPEAAELTRAVLLTTADTVNVTGVNKNKKGEISYKTSDGKTHKPHELKFLPYTLPAYYENVAEFFGKQYETLDKIQKMLPHSSLSYVPSGFYKVRHTDYPFNGLYGAIITRGASGVFDALLMMLFAAILIFVLTRLLTLIPGMPHDTQRALGILIFPPIIFLYVLFVSGLSVNIIVAIIAMVQAVKKNNEQAYYHRCLLCLHGYKLKYLGKKLVDTKVSEGWEHFDENESRHVGDNVTYEVNRQNGQKREISREGVYEYRRVSGEAYIRRTIEFWEDQFYCSHCKKQSAYSKKEYKTETLGYRNVKKGSWH